MTLKFLKTLKGAFEYLLHCASLVVRIQVMHASFIVSHYISR